jgi:hypothetical protein
MSTVKDNLGMWVQNPTKSLNMIPSKGLYEQLNITNLNGFNQIMLKEEFRFWWPEDKEQRDSFKELESLLDKILNKD